MGVASNFTHQRCIKHERAFMWQSIFLEQFLHKRSESYQCYSLPCTKTLRSTTMQKFEVSIIFVQGYKCAGPSTKLIWCGTCLKRRISNRERIQCGKNDLIKTSNTLKILFIEYFPLKEWGNLLKQLHFLIFFYFRFLVPRLVQRKIVAKQILQISCVSIKLMLGNT